MRLKRIIVFCFITFSLSVNAQIIQKEVCGHINHNFSLKSKKKKSDEIKLYLDSCNYNPEIEAIKYRIPVKFWVYRRTNGKDGLSESKIKEHIRSLNYYHSINNTGFRFYLRPDVEYIDKDRLFKLKYILQSPFQTVKKKSKACINVYVPEKLKMNRIFRTAKNFSGTYNSFTKGVIIAKGVSSSTLSHEIGHYFGLKHPHKYWRSKLKGEPVSRTHLISGTNIRMCEKKGDGLCDTPAEPNLSNYTDDNCKYTGWNIKDKYGEVYKPATDNIMSYTKNRECRNNFTQEQIALMLYTASKNKYGKYWSSDIKNADNYNFDYFEPDNTEETASEIFFRTTQTHTFHKIYAKRKKNKFKDDVDWVYFNLKTTIPKTLKITISESEYEFPKMRISVYKNSKIIFEMITDEKKEFYLDNIKNGKHSVKIQQISNDKKITSYKIKIDI